MDKQTLQDYYEFHLDSFNDLDKGYPDLFFKSTLIWIYSFFESHLKAISRLLENEFHFDKKIDDFSRKPTAKHYREFLTKVVKIDLSSVEGTWNKIQGFQKIRNSIIHDNSVLYDKLSKIEKEEKYLYKLISKHKDTLKIDTDSKSFKITDSKLLKEFTKLMYTYIKFIVGQTKEIKLPKKWPFTFPT